LVAAVTRTRTRTRTRIFQCYW